MKQSLLRKVILVILAMLPIMSISFAAKAALTVDRDSSTSKDKEQGSGESTNG